jgi:hypothetical protein
MTERETDQAPVPGRKTPISTDPIGVDPIGYDPLDLSDAPPRKTEGPNRTLLGWAGTASTVFIAAVVLGVIFLLVIIYLAIR